ncbi:MAG: GNAT family N-acetyltransferase [Burkholderiaceae bacterium]|nr:GNAT family N-acetyltransferase [Burkholderiaceae bacterium]
MSKALSLGSWSDLGNAAAKIRFAVFVDEQNVPQELELDDLDPLCVHALIQIDGQPVATGRLCPDGRIGRMAVIKAFRGQGLGDEILGALISAAASRGQSETHLHAQVHALGFYERHGYTADGPEFEEAGIAHRTMRRRIKTTR